MNRSRPSKIFFMFINKKRTKESLTKQNKPQKSQNTKKNKERKKKRRIECSVKFPTESSMWTWVVEPPQQSESFKTLKWSWSHWAILVTQLQTCGYVLAKTSLPLKSAALLLACHSNDYHVYFLVKENEGLLSGAAISGGCIQFLTLGWQIQQLTHKL